MCSDVVELCKGDHSAERLQIERERLKLEKERSEKQVRDKVAELLKQGEKGALSPEERNDRLREIFGLPRAEKRNGGISPETLAEIERAAKLL